MNIILKNFGKKFGKKIIFEEQNKNVEIKDVVCLVGESGIGKSTFINILLNIDKNYSGEIEINDNNDTLKIGLMPQSDKLLDGMTVYENIESFCEVGYLKNIDSILEELGILSLRNVKVEKISGGQKQRVNLARTLINNPSLCILDEPTSNLDDENADIVIELIEKISLEKKIRFLIISHDIRVQNFFKKHITIKERKIITNFESKNSVYQKTKKVPFDYNSRNFFEISKKINKKTNYISSALMNSILLLFCLFLLLSFSNINGFKEVIGSLFGKNGGTIINTHFVEKDESGCDKILEYELCLIEGTPQIPGIYFLQLKK